MTKHRAHIGLKTRLCSALCQLVRYDEHSAEFVKIIPYLKSKTMTEEEILAVFEFHHFPIPKSHDGPDVHWNLQPMEKAKHRERTAKIDIPDIAKGKRIRRKNEASAERRAARDRGEPKPKSRWPSRPIRSRNQFARAP